MSYEELKDLYSRTFALSYLNTSIEERLAVVGLICNVTHQLQMKKPGVTCYQVIMKIMENCDMVNSMQEFLTALSIMCEDTMRNCSKFSDFGIKEGKKQVAKIKEILSTWLPF